MKPPATLFSTWRNGLQCRTGDLILRSTAAKALLSARAQRLPMKRFSCAKGSIYWIDHPEGFIQIQTRRSHG